MGVLLVCYCPAGVLALAGLAFVDRCSIQLVIYFVKHYSIDIDKMPYILYSYQQISYILESEVLWCAGDSKK
jgi:hypothetical protein